jgi:catechol 2,3-dioxygenase-like lactoylglutathione lyase family enzyme
MNLRLGIVQINVTDLTEAWRFYVDTLGLQGVERLGRGKPFDLVLENGPTILVYLVEKVAVRSYPTDTGVTLVFYTPDIRNTVATWKNRGVAFIPIAWSREASGIAETPFGPFIAFRDPFGNVHELLQPA